MAVMKGRRIATRQRTTTTLRVLFLMIFPTAASKRFTCLSIFLASFLQSQTVIFPFAF